MSMIQRTPEARQSGASQKEHIPFLTLRTSLHNRPQTYTLRTTGTQVDVITSLGPCAPLYLIQPLIAEWGGYWDGYGPDPSSLPRISSNAAGNTIQICATRIRISYGLPKDGGQDWLDSRNL